MIERLANLIGSGTEGPVSLTCGVMTFPAGKAKLKSALPLPGKNNNELTILHSSRA